MGKFDDVRYVEEMKKEFKEPNPTLSDDRFEKALAQIGVDSRVTKESLINNFTLTANQLAQL
jgi:hypothetical protein